MSKLKTNYDNIIASWEKLRSQWQNTSAVWRDSEKFRFEKEYWQEYEPIIHDALRQLERLDQILDQAKREVK